VVIDGDRHGGPDGVAAVEQLIAEHKLVAATIPTVTTPQDGRHYWFRQPTEGDPIGNSDKAVRDRGINVRGAGGYVIAPGAMLPDGRRYRRDAATPSTIEALQDQAIPVLPPAIVAVLRKPNGHDLPGGEISPPDQAQPAPVRPSTPPGAREEAYARGALESLARERSAMAPDSGRNIELNNAAIRIGHMVAAGWIGRATVEGRLFDAATACGLLKDDGAHHVRATIKSGLDAGVKEPAGALPELRWFHPKPGAIGNK
jgi:Bifunctional DNA primase/polymerase, N-terminal